MKNDYLESTIASYNKNSRNYLQDTKDMILLPEVEEFLKQVDPRGLILDAGCGYGKYTKIFLEKHYYTVGIDFSKGLLKEARKYIPNGEFHFMDIRKLNFPNSTFSGIWCAATLPHLILEDMQTALHELCRVLKKDGSIFITFKEGQGSGIVSENFAGKRERFFTFVSKEQVEYLLQEAGFTLTEIGESNEQKRFGKEYRDQNWINAFAIKKG